MKIVFLGTNGWYTTETGNTPCILIDSKDQYVVFDAGNGIYKLDKYITENKPVSLFITHFHIDHTSGLHTLAKFNFPQGIDVYVGEGRGKDFETLVNPPFTIGYKPQPENIMNLKTEIRLHELSEGEHKLERSEIPVSVVKVFHAYGAHGYRITLEGKTIAYTGDCGLTDNARKLAQDADLLISECSNIIETKDSENWGHLTPVLAATLAKEANVKRLALTHFVSNMYLTLEDRKKAERRAQEIFPNTIAATDDLEILL
jgi:ribonuclease BN (tRNA processing enzyme)